MLLVAARAESNSFAYFSAQELLGPGSGCPGGAGPARGFEPSLSGSPFSGFRSHWPRWRHSGCHYGSGVAASAPLEYPGEEPMSMSYSYVFSALRLALFLDFMRPALFTCVSFTRLSSLYLTKLGLPGFRVCQPWLLLRSMYLFACPMSADFADITTIRCSSFGLLRAQVWMCLIVSFVE